MVKVNTKELKEALDFLCALLNRHEEATLDLFKTIEHTSDFWKDNRSILFYNKIAEEKILVRKIRENLKKRKDLYKYIYDSYSKFGEKIECDYENKSTMLKKMDYAVEQLDIIIKRFNNLDTFFSFKEKSFLSDQRRRLVKLKKEYQDYRTGLRRFLEQIESIELKVRKKTKELEEINIKHFILE